MIVARSPLTPHAATRPDAPAHAGLGLVLLQAQRYAPSVEALERALALDPDLELARTILATLHKHLQ